MTIQEKFPKNRFTALNEIQSLLGFRRFEMMSFLETLCKAEDAFLGYSFGNLSIKFTINDGILGCIKPFEETDPLYEKDCNKKNIQLSLELEKGNVRRSISYRYNIEELKRFNRTSQLRIESFRGD